jgi:hypothetical protein
LTLTFRRFRRALTCVVVVACVAGAAQAFSANLTTQNEVVRTRTARVDLAAAGGSPTTIASAKVAAGKWVISGFATLVNFGPSDYTRCDLARGTTHLGQASAIIGDGAKAGSAGPGAYVGTLYVIATVTSPVPFTASLRCFHDKTTPSGNAGPYVDADASLWLHRAS